MKIAVIIPCYGVKDHILQVIAEIDQYVAHIYVVDDACPQQTGDYVKKHCHDPRVKIITHDNNQGVGGAVISGYLSALQDNCNILVKIDGDGQMNPKIIRHFTKPIIEGKADYCKGNRFYKLSHLYGMPKIRIIGNAILSLMSKSSSGYWHIFDPTNGYTAIHATLIRHIDTDKINKRYFFESDMLFHLYNLRAKIVDIPMKAIYGNEKSNLVIRNIIFSFLWQHVKNFMKRIAINYYIRDMNIASIELFFGLVLFVFGITFGGYHWFDAHIHHIQKPVGTIMLAALFIILGFQLLLSFIAFDISNTPKEAIHSYLDEENH